MKRSTNRILLVVLVLLLALFVLTKIFRTPALESNLDKDLFRLDTARIAEITFRLNDGTDDLTLKRNDGSWTIRQESKSAGADDDQVKSLLETLSNLQPERVVSRKKEKWNDYEVGDTTGMQFVAYGDDRKEVAKWRIGKQNLGLTYVRLENGAEVYTVEGNLRSRFDKKFNAWRDKTFLRVKKDLIDNITFRYPSDSGFVLEKKSGSWMINDQKADSAKIENYLGRLQSKDLTNFAAFSPTGGPDVTVSIHGTAMPETFVKGWKEKASDHKWILSSSAQEGVYFSDSTFAAQLFPSERALRK